MKFEKRKNKKEKDNFWVPKNVQESIPHAHIEKMNCLKDSPK